MGRVCTFNVDWLPRRIVARLRARDHSTFGIFRARDRTTLTSIDGIDDVS